jgi:ribosomal protein S6
MKQYNWSTLFIILLIGQLFLQIKTGSSKIQKMPLYELIYLMSEKMSMKMTSQIIKEKANLIFENKGVLRRLENMGVMPLAYPMFRHQKKWYKARYVLFLFDGSPQLRKKLEDSLARDTEIMRWVFYKQKNKFRDAYDELYYHEGVEFGKTLDAREELLMKTQQGITEVLNTPKGLENQK